MLRTTKQMNAVLKKMQDLYEASERLFDIDEKASDEAYNRASAMCDNLVDTIINVTHGMIDKRTARTMVLGKTDKLIALCERF